jgi:hypothetical protein
MVVHYFLAESVNNQVDNKPMILYIDGKDKHGKQFTWNAYVKMSAEEVKNKQKQN